MAESQTVAAGWVSPSSITIKLEGGSTLYDADLITVVASPFGSAIQSNATSTTNTDNITPSTNEPPISNSPASNEPSTASKSSTTIIPSDESTSSNNDEPSLDKQEPRIVNLMR